MVARYNADLANNFGNLANRVLNMAVNYCDGVVPEQRADGPLVDAVASAFAAQTDAFERLDIASAFAAVWELIGAANAYIEDAKPWALNKAGDSAATAAVIGDCLEALRVVALLASPAIPRASAELWRRLGLPGAPTDQRLPDAVAWGGLPAGATSREGRAALPAHRDVTWFDSHCHLQMLDVPVADALARSRDAGVGGVVCVGTDLESSAQAVEVAAREPDVWATVGLHPHDATAQPGEWPGIVELSNSRPGGGDRRDRARLLLRAQPARGADRELPCAHPTRTRA